jgi:hypothetical protein
MSRPGPRMLDVAAYVADNPGCCKAEVTRGCGLFKPFGGRESPIERAIRAGLIEAKRPRVNRYALYPPDTQHWTPGEPQADGYWQPGHP